MIDPNYYDSFLKNIPPEESVNGLLGLAESLEKIIIDRISVSYACIFNSAYVRKNQIHKNRKEISRNDCLLSGG